MPIPPQRPDGLMSPAQLRRARLLVIALIASMAVLVGGCATWQGPRIDPSGQRLFLWPGEPQPYVPTTVVPPAPVITPPGTRPVIAPPAVPVAAPPVGTPMGAPVIAPAPAAPVVQPLPSVVP